MSVVIQTRRQAKQLFFILVCIQLLLVVAYSTDAWVQGPTGQLHAVIDLDAEGNLPTWFSSFQLSLIAITIWFWASRTKPVFSPSRRFLRAFAGLFLLLSIDETAMLHERLTNELGSRYIDWVPAYLWSHPWKTGACLVVLASLLRAVLPHLKGIWRLDSRATKVVIAGLIVYFTGAAVLETIGYKMLVGGSSISLYRLEVVAEEFLEMFGASLILYAVLLFYCAQHRSLRAADHLDRTESALVPERCYAER